MPTNFKKILSFAFLALFFLLADRTSAATIYLLPETKDLSLNQKFQVNIVIDTEEMNINAAQAAISFPTNILKLLSVDKTGSIFDFWLEEPVVAGNAGALSFMGGTPRGVSGGTLKVLSMNFEAIGSGTASINFSNGAVVASDGKGTNVLSSMKGVEVKVGKITGEIAPTPVAAPETTAELPKKITREPEAAKGLPTKPNLRVSLYPDQNKWYNQLGDLIVLWELPADITQIATKIGQIQSSQRGRVETELYNGKNFGVLKEGIWWAGIQFKNNIGWGETSYYKISLDITPPLPFNIEIDNKVSDNPTPEIKFQTQDSLSGIAAALISIDNGKPIESKISADSKMALTLPTQAPGKHSVRVQVVDLASNSREDILDFEILPLPTPKINFLSKKILQEEFIFASGDSIPNGLVDIKILDKTGREVFAGEIKSDNSGGWNTNIQAPLAAGNYSISFSARNERGAASYPSESYKVTVRPKAIISIGFIDLNWLTIVLIIVLLFLLIILTIGWRYNLKRNKRQAYQMIARRDVEKLCNLLVQDLKELEIRAKKQNNFASSEAKAEVETYFEKIKTTITKMKKYLGQEINKLK